MFELKPLSMQYLIDMMANGEYFTFSRYKDGEFYAILQNKKGGHNCDRHTYYPEMGEAILNSLLNVKDHMYGMQPLVYRYLYEQVDNLFTKHNININWYESDMLHAANRDGKFFPFLEQLRKMDVVVIGPERIKAIKGKLLDNVEFVTVPLKNCWLEKDRIEADILRVGGSNKIYLFSASMPTPVMIDDLFPSIGKDCWMMDFGSIWESLLGINIRSYQRGMTEETRRRNLGE